MRGWPVILGHKIQCAAAVADLDGDGRDELAVALRDGRVFLLDGYGRPLKGWPQVTKNVIYYSALLADLDGDGGFEVIVACWDGYVYAWKDDGSSVPGWPVDIGAMPLSSPQLLHLEPGGDAGILVACRNRNVHLLDPSGVNHPGWPCRVGEQYSGQNDCFPVRNADLDGDGRPEILFLAREGATLHIWSSKGINYPGFPRELGENGLGIALDKDRDPTRIACTTLRELIVLDTGGREILHVNIEAGDGNINTAPSFVSSVPGQEGDLLLAATKGGTVYMWDGEGNQRPGWPIHLSGFIYGLTGDKERFNISAAPTVWDVDGDGGPEILVGSSDQHLYCFELDGRPHHGWPLTLGDAISAAPAFAQLDGMGRKEMVIGQMGETIFAFHLEPMVPGKVVAYETDSDLYGSREWPPLYFAVAGAIVLLLFLLVQRLRLESGSAYHLGSGGWAILFLFALLLLIRCILFADELQRYLEMKHSLHLAEPVVERVMADEREMVLRRAVIFASALDSCRALDGKDPIRLLYQMERLADRHRMDYRHTGLMVTDESGCVIQALGLARGWIHLDNLGLSFNGTNEPILLGGIPVHVGQAPVGEGDDSGHFFLFASLLNTIPHTLADATGYSAHIQLGGRTLAWGGATSSAARVWPWLGIVEPANDITLSKTRAGPPLILHLATEDFERTSSGWMDLGIVLLLPVIYYVVSIGRGMSERLKLSWWWLLAFALTYAAGWLLFSNRELIQRPVPFAGHYLEFLLHSTGLLGMATALRALVGTRRGRRLSFAVLGSYLVVGLLPLVLVFLIAISLLQQAQRRVIQDMVTDLGERADHLVMAYMGNIYFQHDLRATARRLLELPPEAGYLDFVAYDEFLFTYELPSAYLTLWAHDCTDPSRYFTGYSWRAPRTEKFYARRPVWAGDRHVKGLFLDGSNSIIRSMRTLRIRLTPELEVRLTGHVPLDRAVIEDMEDRLRIMPFLPCVRLRPAWLQPEDDPQPSGEWNLPFGTKLVLPARDWRTGAPRWIVYLANAYLPAGRERWTVISTMILLALLPLVLSVWGAYFTFKQTVRPLTRLLTGIRRVETGDLEYRLVDTGQSEIALAARAFDRMADSLKTKVQELAEKKKVEEVSALKSRFISMVSHDLKTPLSSITGAAENVLEELAGPVTDRQRTYLEMILSSSGNLQQMISDLLDLSHIESGRMVLEIETLDLRREVDNVLRSIRPLLDERKLEIQIAVTAESTTLEADRTRLWQIINNIISNAVRYSPAGGRIQILMEDALDAGTGRYGLLRTTITDQGPGISEEEHSKLFEPFYGRPAGPDGKHGAGLGLAIVKQLVELHGGEVSIKNCEGSGASFSFTLPTVRPLDSAAR